MTSANMGAVKQSVAAFKSLDINDRLAAMALIYSKAAGSIPANAIKADPAGSEVVTQLEQMSQDKQVGSLGDLLSAKKKDPDEVVLDPNPSKALTELISGGNTFSTGQYGAMSSESKLAVWYQIGQKLGSTIVAIPSDYSPSSKVSELLSSLDSLEVADQMSFLTRVI